MPGVPFDLNKAVIFGRFVAAAYTMYGQSPTNLTPQPSNDFPQGYKLTAWVQMQDFILDSTSPDLLWVHRTQRCESKRGGVGYPWHIKWRRVVG